MTGNWPWVTSLLLHGVLFILLFLWVLPESLTPDFRPSRIEIRLPVLGQDFSTMPDQVPASEGRVGELPESTSSFLPIHSTFPEVAGTFYSEASPEAPRGRELSAGFPKVDFHDIYKERAPAAKEASLFWEEGSEAVGSQEFPGVEDLPLTGDMEITWTGTVSALGQWKDLPEISSGIAALDSRITRWLLGLELRPSPTGQDQILRFRLKISLRKPQ